MPNYKIRDNQTGQVYTLRGDSPPTQQEMESLFGATRNIQTNAPNTVDQSRDNQPGLMQRLAGGFSDIFSPRMKAMGQQLTSAGVMNRQLPGIRQRQDQGFGSSRRLIDQAKQATDPMEKQRLLQLSRQMDQDTGQEINTLMDQTKQNLGKDYERLNRTSSNNFLANMVNPAYARTGAGVAGEAGALLMPQLKPLKGATAAGRIANAGISGGARGLLVSGTDPYTESMGEHLGNTAMGTGLGAVVGAGMQTLGEGAKKVVGATKGRFDRALEQQRASQPAQPGTAFSKAPTVGEKMNQSRYTIPTKLGEDIKLDKTLKQLKPYGLANLPMDDQLVATQLTTGPNGAITGMTYETLLATNQPIQIDDAMGLVSKKTWNFASPEQVTNVARDITDDFTNAGLRPTPNGYVTDPVKAFNLVQTLEKKAYQNYGKSTYLTGRLDAEDIGDMYMATARAVMKNIEKQAGKAAVDQAKKPEYLAQLGAVSPELAKRAQNATSLSELRSIAAPFVRLNRAIDLTRMAQNSQMVKFINAQANQLSLDPIKMGQTVARRTIASPDNLARMGGVIDTLAGARDVVGQQFQKPIVSQAGNLLQRLGTVGSVNTIMDQPR